MGHEYVPYITISPFKRYPYAAVFRERKSRVTTTTSTSGKIKERKRVESKIVLPRFILSGTIKKWILRWSISPATARMKSADRREYFFMASERKHGNMAKVKGKCDGRYMEYPPSWFISQEILYHATSTGNDREHRRWIWPQDEPSTTPA